MALNLSAPVLATGAGVTASAAAVSSVAIVNQMSLNTPQEDILLKDKMLFREDNTDFDLNKFFDFKNTFETRKVNRSDTNKPILPFVAGACFQGFFPGAALTRPEQEASDKAALTSIIPTGFTFSDGKPMMGCRMLKFSKAKDQAGFGYMGETVVQNGNFGLALYSAATNIKQQQKTDLEYWLLFLEKSGSWTVKSSFRWSKELQTNSSGTVKQHAFSTKRDQAEYSKWEWQPKDTGNVSQFFGENVDPAKADLWDTDDAVAYLWFTEAKGAASNEMFQESSNEKWALRDRFNDASGSSTTPPVVKLLEQVNLKRKGEWVTADTHCNSLHKGRDNEPGILDGEKHICFNKKYASKFTTTSK